MGCPSEELEEVTIGGVMFIRTVFISILCFVSCLLWGEEKSQGRPLQEVVVERILERLTVGKRSSFENQLFEILIELKREGYVWRVGQDASLRPLFVTAQGLIEEVCSNLLKEGQLAGLCGAIHTPLPATPLCSDGTITEKLVAASLEKDRQRLVTVTFRAGVMRDYLSYGGKLFVVYPKGGDLKRTEPQRAIYRGLLAEHPKTLFDFPIERPLPSFLIGATYRITGVKGDEIVFGIGAVQANAPEDGITWRLWLGDPKVNRRCLQRVQAVECLMGRKLKI